MTADTPSQVGSYELEINIDRPRAQVWKALTTEAGTWWLASFHVVGEGSVVTFEAEARGQLLEKRADGSSLLWYTVQMVEVEKSIRLVGYSFPQWGGPVTSFLKLGLEAVEGGCKLSVSDAHVGNVTGGHQKSLREGWTELFTDGLKAFCEAAE